jgi:hypothetical protein
MSARITSATGVPAPDLRKPAIMSSRVRMPCTLPRLSVIGNSCCDVHSNASAENDHFIFTYWRGLRSGVLRELLLYDGIRDAKLLGKLEQQAIEKA